MKKTTKAKKGSATEVPVVEPVREIIHISSREKPSAMAGRKFKARKKHSAPKVTPSMPSKEFSNSSKKLAFAFAARIQKELRAADEREQEELTALPQGVHLKRRPKTRLRGEATTRFPDADLEDFKRRLERLRAQLSDESISLKTVALESTDDRGSEDEDGSDATMRLQNLTQVDSRNRNIQKIDEALRRIADGSYGVCEVCGKLIRKPRLLNLPFVHTCMECQSRMEYRRHS